MSVGIDEERNLESEQIKGIFEPKEHEKIHQMGGINIMLELKGYQNQIKCRTALMAEQLADSKRFPGTLFHPNTNGLGAFKSHINTIDGNKEKLHQTAGKLFRVFLR